MRHRDGGFMPGLVPISKVLMLGAVFVTACQRQPPAITDTRVPAQVRVVSTSLCGDAYVLTAFPDRDIAALSWQADSPLSLAPENLRTRSKARDDIETLLALKPSLVVFGPGEGLKSAPLLDKVHIKHVTLNWVEDRKGISANLKKLGGQKMDVSTSEENLRTRRRVKQNGPKPKILYLIPSGTTAGPGTYVDMVIREAGGKNIITKPGWQTPDVETLAALEPDLIVTSFFQDGYESVNAAGLTNKILKNKIRRTPHVNVPGRFWTCATPYIDRAKNLITHSVQGLN